MKHFNTVLEEARQCRHNAEPVCPECRHRFVMAPSRCFVLQYLARASMGFDAHPTDTGHEQTGNTANQVWEIYFGKAVW